MGYAYCVGACLACDRVFSFNPNKVPSFRVNGVREPVCESCMQIVNAKRKAQGLEPFVIAEDAYQPCDENELVFGDDD